MQFFPVSNSALTETWCVKMLAGSCFCDYRNHAKTDACWFTKQPWCLRFRWTWLHWFQFWCQGDDAAGGNVGEILALEKVGAFGARGSFASSYALCMPCGAFCEVFFPWFVVLNVLTSDTVFLFPLDKFVGFSTLWACWWPNVNLATGSLTWKQNFDGEFHGYIYVYNTLYWEWLKC